MIAAAGDGLGTGPTEKVPNHANRTHAEVQEAFQLRQWTPPAGPLGELTESSRRRAAQSAGAMRELEQKVRDLAAPPSFAGALRGQHLKVIAEVKRASPSKGLIAPGLDAVHQAFSYERGGAAAVSVLTEPDRFGGSLDDLRDVARAVSIPVLRKDFIVDPVQLLEARVAGASAALLIVRALPPELLRELVTFARNIALEVLLEVREPHELEQAIAVGGKVIGVNNRNLETLVIDVSRAPSLIPSIPNSCIAIAESGMESPSDLDAVVEAGADAVLIGTVLSRAADPERAVAAFAQTARRQRARKE